MTGDGYAPIHKLTRSIPVNVCSVNAPEEEKKFCVVQRHRQPCPSRYHCHKIVRTRTQVVPDDPDSPLVGWHPQVQALVATQGLVALHLPSALCGRVLLPTGSGSQPGQSSLTIINQNMGSSHRGEEQVGITFRHNFGDVYRRIEAWQFGSHNLLPVRSRGACSSAQMNEAQQAQAAQLPRRIIKAGRTLGLNLGGL